MTSLHPTVAVCQDVVELSTELLEGGLDAIARARIEQHLLVCPPCTVHFANVRRAIAFTRELREP